MNFGQEFEGRIIYKNTLKSKISSISDMELSSMMGTTEEYNIKEGTYKIVTNGSFLQWEIYNNSENRLYVKNSNSNMAFWKDASINLDSVINITIHRNVMTILGYNCDEICFVCKTSIEKYYFNSKFHVSAKIFKRHKYGNWFEYLSKANSLPLKIIIDNNQFVIESVAISVTAMKFSNSYFKLPPKLKIKKAQIDN
jgi:hypothetical protein